MRGVNGWPGDRVMLVIASLLALGLTAALVWIALVQGGDEASGDPAAPGVTSPTDPATPSGPTVSPTPTATDAPTSGSPTTLPPGPPSTGPYVERVVTVAGGEVTVRCTGDALALRGASSAGGWSVAAEQRGSGEATVTFSSGERTSTVTTTCVGGVPRVVVEDAESG